MNLIKIYFELCQNLKVYLNKVIYLLIEFKSYFIINQFKLI